MRAENMTKTQEMLLENWTDSSIQYSSSILGELESFKRQAWTDLILNNAGTDGKLNILDVGTGPGFFAIILSLAGHDVTAVDCTEAMLGEAKANAAKYGAQVDFYLSDAQALPFSGDSFDLVVSRNVVWTIVDAEKAYHEWLRVLRPGGRLLVFDANWNIRFFREEKLREYNADRGKYEALYPDSPLPQYSREMEDFRKSMPLCAQIRPQWDLDVLLRAGVSKITCQPDLRSVVYDEKEQLLNKSTPMFMISVEK